MQSVRAKYCEGHNAIAASNSSGPQSVGSWQSQFELANSMRNTVYRGKPQTASELKSNKLTSLCRLTSKRAGATQIKVA